MVDTGVYGKHEDLRGRVTKGKSFPLQRTWYTHGFHGSWVEVGGGEESHKQARESPELFGARVQRRCDRRYRVGGVCATVVAQGRGKSDQPKSWRSLEQRGERGRRECVQERRDCGGGGRQFRFRARATTPRLLPTMRSRWEQPPRTTASASTCLLLALR